MKIFDQSGNTDKRYSLQGFSLPWLVAGVAVVTFFLGAGFFIFGNMDRGEAVQETGLKQEGGEALRTPPASPFEDLTIPYLRSRDYVSVLGERTLWQEGQAYSSYITSYNSDDLLINGLLTIPNSEEPESGWPAVVFVHGYIPPSEYKTTQRYQDYVDYLARNNVVVFKIDLRGHGDSEGVPGGAYYSGDYVIDTLNAVAALEQADFVNSQKIGVWGHSMAGNVIFRALVASEKIKTAVIWAGAVYSYEDWGRYSLRDSSYQPPDPDSTRRRERNELLETHGSYSAESEFWQRVVPLNYTDGVAGAVQLHHAVNDSVVNIGYSRDLVNALKSTGIQAQVYEYETGGHNIESPSFSVAMERTVEFYKERLGF